MGCCCAKASTSKSNDAEARVDVPPATFEIVTNPTALSNTASDGPRVQTTSSDSECNEMEDEAKVQDSSSDGEHEVAEDVAEADDVAEDEDEMKHDPPSSSSDSDPWTEV